MHRLTLASVSPLIRPRGPRQRQSLRAAADFVLYPAFFTPGESAQLVRMALWKLDRVDSARRRWKRAQRGGAGAEGFHGEYGFEEGHYDSVIHHYRESLISALPPEAPEGGEAVYELMRRVYALLPGMNTELADGPSGPTPSPSWPGQAQGLAPPGTSTHALHLAPHGAILPHVDNLEASGSCIVGVSLGAERTMRLERVGGGQGQGEAGAGAMAEEGARARAEVANANAEGEGEGWDVRLPSGSVYFQRDSIRYGYKHSILPYDDPGSVWDGERLEAGHRLSLMVRDAPPAPLK